MGAEVYANGNAIACKKSDDKVIAAFPDVCLSPPSPPAGPLPIPYPNTSFSKDMKNGSKRVKIGGSEVMLKDQSYYKSSPLGDEAATRSFGANVLSHSITGKTYFAAWSMDVKFEGENVDRHLDLTTSNHSSYPAGVAVPNPAMEKLALERIDKGRCPCCNKDLHTVTGSTVTPVKWYTSKPDAMGMSEWYKKVIDNALPGKCPPAQKAIEKAKFDKLLADAQKKPRPGCKCKSKNSKVLPEPPCDVFWHNPGTAAKDNIKDAWDDKRRNTKYQSRNGIIPLSQAMTKWVGRVTAKLTEKLGRAPIPAELTHGIKEERKVNHLTPKTAGGCPTGNNNLQPHNKLCAACQKMDADFSRYQDWA